MLEQRCNNSKQCSNNVATLCFIKLQTVGTTTNLTNSKGDATREDSQRRFFSATQRCNDIVSNTYIIVPTLQPCVAQKTVVANRLA